MNLLRNKLWLLWDWKRALLHFPVGAVVYPAGHYVPDDMAGAVIISLVVGFLGYEIMEAMRLKDHAYIDIQGWLIGLFAGVVIVCLVR